MIKEKQIKGWLLKKDFISGQRLLNCGKFTKTHALKAIENNSNYDCVDYCEFPGVKSCSC